MNKRLQMSWQILISQTKLTFFFLNNIISNVTEVNAQCFSVKQLLKASINISAMGSLFQFEMYSYTTYEPTLMKFYKPRDFTEFYYIIDDTFFDWILITFTSSISHTLLSSDLTVSSSRQTSSKDS